MAERSIEEILLIEDDYERRIELLILRLPQKMRPPVHWLRKPEAKWLRLPAGVLLMCGGLLAILPVFGLWMLPLGFILLSQDVPYLRKQTNRMLEWVERRKPHWLGLS